MLMHLLLYGQHFLIKWAEVPPNSSLLAAGSAPLKRLQLWARHKSLRCGRGKWALEGQHRSVWQHKKQSSPNFYMSHEQASQTLQEAWQRLRTCLSVCWLWSALMPCLMSVCSLPERACAFQTSPQHQASNFLCSKTSFRIGSEKHFGSRRPLR